MAKKKPIHYVNNAEFSAAVVEYVKSVNEAKERGEELPIVTDYLARSFMNIAEGLSHRSNFILYTYREEMVMDAVENCLKAIENYNIEAATRTGNPNAFGYFTQISWYAFLRRIKKENKERDLKTRYLIQSGLDMMAEMGDDQMHTTVTSQFVDTLKSRIDKIREIDTGFSEFKKAERKKRTVYVDSDLGDYIE